MTILVSFLLQTFLCGSPAVFLFSLVPFFCFSLLEQQTTDKRSKQNKKTKTGRVTSEAANNSFADLGEREGTDTTGWSGDRVVWRRLGN